MGARFLAVNKGGRGPAWTNKPVITVAEPGHEFVFRRTEKFAGTILWRYQFSPEADGTRVAESYGALEPISRLGWFFIGVLGGHKDRRAELHAGIEQSLERLREAVKHQTHAPPT